MKNDEDLALIGVIAALVLAFAPAVLAAAAAWALFRYVVAPRWGNWWFGWFAAGTAALFIVLLVLVPGAAAGYFKAYAHLAAGVFKKDLSGVEWVFLLPAAFPGLALGAAFARLQLKNQPAQEGKQGAGWAEKRALAKIGRELHPAGGVLLGVEHGTGKRVVLTDEELNQHLFLVGTTGSGKTTTIMNFAESAVQRGLPLILVDGKGDPALAGRVKALAERHQRKFYHFSVTGPSARYNPLAVGGTTELKDKLLYLTEWSEPHYEALAARYLQLVFRVFQLTGTRPDLPAAAEYLDPERLEFLVRDVRDEDERQKFFDVLDQFKNAEIKGLAARLAALTESEIGHLFSADGAGELIDLNRVIQENGVVVFSLDFLSFPEYSRLLGRLVVTDLKSAAAKAYGREQKTVYTIFDEFSVFASGAVVDLIGKARGAGFHALIATQSLSDIEAAAGEAVVEQILDNCNTYIIQRQNSPAGAEKLAGVIGTREAWEITQQVEHLMPSLGAGALGGRMGSRRRVREYLVHPDEIKRLQTGEAVLVRKTRFEVRRVRIRKV